jgi:hypothetical protein
MWEPHQAAIHPAARRRMPGSPAEPTPDRRAKACPPAHAGGPPTIQHGALVHRREPASMAAFKDHFSKQAAAYAQARPTYPAALFDAIAALRPALLDAWGEPAQPRRVAWPLVVWAGRA